MIPAVSRHVLSARLILTLLSIGRKIKDRSDETIANIAITLIHQCDVLIRGLIEWKKRDFKERGGIKEEMYRARREWQQRNGYNGQYGTNGQPPNNPIKPNSPKE